MKRPASWLDIRRRRLRSDQDRLRALAAESEMIRIDELGGDPPEGYVFHYRCRGVVDPGEAEPVYGFNHSVEVLLPIEYPTRPPQMRWLTPLYHPNVNEEGTWVCIDVWYPTKFLDDLCVMLGRMIQYRNFNPYNFVRPEAALWARLNEGRFPVDRRPLRKGEKETPSSPVDDFEIRVL